MDLKWLNGDAPEVAPMLQGWGLYVREADGTLTGGIITETEAYTAEDAASHSFRGKTPRNEVMFYGAGHVYVYFTYGMHWCVNIVTGPEHSGQAVLIRAIDPTSGLKHMRQRRNLSNDAHLSDGPAKLCQALDITGLDNGSHIGERLLLKPPTQHYIAVASERIGIRKDTHRPWRFQIDSNSK